MGKGEFAGSPRRDLRKEAAGMIEIIIRSEAPVEFQREYEKLTEDEARHHEKGETHHE
jgi:hypothetical protein